MISANWERNDTNFEKIGTGINESSGTFSFSETGKYLIKFFGGVSGGGGTFQYGGVQVKFTTDNSNYNTRCQSFISTSTTGYYSALSCHVILDVTNISNDKIRLYQYSQNGNGALNGSSDRNDTAITFIRLGDT